VRSDIAEPGGAERAIEREQEQGYVVRVVDLPALFEKLAPELGRRLAASPLAGWSGDLALATADERIVLGIERGRVEVREGRAAVRPAAPNAIEGGPELAQLVVGGEAPLETVLGAGTALRGEAGRLLDVLFPPQHPQMDNQAL
jgi:hypothetical protein